jgi:acyl-CoA thioesterase YciA
VSDQPSSPVINALPGHTIPALRVIAMPESTNAYGDIFGGWIMAQLDVAGWVAARARANGKVATVAVNSIQFKEPVFVGDLLSFYSTIVKTGRTSITVEVEVYAERLNLHHKVVKVTEATLVYVATDEQRRPRPLPELPA